jgi:hypothetical protein
MDMKKALPIIGIVLAVFFLAVAYKYIASGIDEQRQKSATNDKAASTEQLRNTLSNCLAAAESNFAKKSTDWLSLYADQVRRGEKTQVEASQEMYTQKAVDQKQEAADKQECYKLYQ